MKKDFVDKIVDAIIYDLSNRKGIGNEWEWIDDEVKEEIAEKWKDIVLRYIGGMSFPRKPIPGPLRIEE